MFFYAVCVCKVCVWCVYWGSVFTTTRMSCALCPGRAASPTYPGLSHQGLTGYVHIQNLQITWMIFFFFQNKTVFLLPFPAHLAPAVMRITSVVKVLLTKLLPAEPGAALSAIGPSLCSTAPHTSPWLPAAFLSPRGCSLFSFHASCSAPFLFSFSFPSTHKVPISFPHLLS